MDSARENRLNDLAADSTAPGRRAAVGKTKDKDPHAGEQVSRDTGADESGAEQIQIGPYRLLDRFSQGGMGYLLRAEDSRLQRIVALKFLSPELHQDERAKTRFLREARAASKIEHPNICAVHEVNETDDGRLYIVMPYYQGESLKERLTRGPLNVDDAIAVTRQVATGLARAHREGIVHRDVKPANIFLTDEAEPPGLVKLLDFGIAKVHGNQPLTDPGRLVGTPYYMAPEQILGRADQRSDIWALGIVLYEMLTGIRPFRGNMARAIRSVLEDDPAPLSEARPEMPEFLCQIVDRALTKNPDERFQSIEELVALLPAVGTGGMPILEKNAAESADGSTPQRLMIVSFLVVAALLAGVFFSWLVGAFEPAASEPTGINPDHPELASTERRAQPLQPVAVFPFSVQGDERYAYLHEGMMDLLSTQLDGAGAVRATDPKLLLHQRVQPLVDLESRVDLAQRVGAEMMVVGHVVEVADQLRLNAILHRVTGGAPRVVTASAEGPASEIFSLVDSLAAQLLGGMDDGAAARVQRLASLTTESFPALKSYLDGESAWRSGRFADAAEDFQLAVTQDPRFALAWYRLGVARSWLLDSKGSEQALRQAQLHGDRLSVDDRRLLEALEASHRGDAEAAERLCLEVLSRRPDDLEAWVALGEVSFHLGPLFGRSISHSRAYWQRVVELEPDDRQALLHLARLDVHDQDYETLKRRSERLLTLLEGSERATEPLFFLAMMPDAAKERTQLRQLLLGSELGIPWFSAGFTLGSSSLVMQTWESFYRELLTPGRSPREQSFGRRHLAMIALASGRLGEADQHFASATLAPEPDQEYRALAATVPFLPVSDEKLANLITAVEAWPSQPITEFSFLQPQAAFPAHERLYVLGLLHARAGRTNRTLALADELSSLGEVEAFPGLGRDLENGLRAEIAWQASQYQKVLEFLAERHGRYTYELTLVSPVLSQARERYLKARALENLEQLKEALAWFETLPEVHVFDLAYFSASLEHRANIYQQLGDKKQARLMYERLIDLWRAADPELQPRVEEARRQLQAL